MPGPWKVEGLPGRRYLCWRKMEWSAKQVAKKLGRSVKVVFAGRRRKYPNRQRDSSSFTINAQGQKNFKVDPTWWENPKPK